MSGRSRLTSRRSRLRGRWPSRRWRWATGIVGLLLAGGALWTIAPFWRIAGQFGETPARIPSRLFESPPVLETGTRIADADLVALFVARGYREAMDPGPLPVGRYRQDAQRLAVQLRPFPSPSGMTRAVELSIEVEGNRIARLDLGGQRVESVWIDPRLLATYYSPRLADVWPVRVDELPRHAIEAVLAAEDIGFFRHPGLSLNGILRALWVNFRGGRIQQGGSTLTQQLVKNLYLTADRTWARKAREAVLAVLLELRYEKRQILQAYLNEIFLGRVGPVNLVGIGSASRAYFGVPASELSLTEAATLAGLIRSPSRLSPVAHPEELRARRNEVLARMAELGWLDAEVMRGAQDAALGVREPSLDLRRARYAADAAASEARRRFGLPGLEDRGYTVISTLDFDDQIAAEKWLGWGASRVDGRSRRGTGRVEAALLSADPHDGRVLAWVGGRDYAVSQFDRIRFAKRQPGSAFKPVVLAAAFAERTATPSALLVDEPITVHQGSQEWSPNNDDLEFRGVVSVRQAIEQSLNVPTVRLALDVGLERVISWGRELGIESPMAKVPSLALGGLRGDAARVAASVRDPGGRGCGFRAAPRRSGSRSRRHADCWSSLSGAEARPRCRIGVHGDLGARRRCRTGHRPRRSYRRARRHRRRQDRDQQRRPRWLVHWLHPRAGHPQLGRLRRRSRGRPLRFTSRAAVVGPVHESPASGGWLRSGSGSRGGDHGDHRSRDRRLGDQPLPAGGRRGVLRRPEAARAVSGA